MSPLEAQLLDAAGRSPSAHNSQPWRLRFVGDSRLEVFLDRNRTLPAIDPADLESYHGIGAMLENVLLTLRHLGYRGRYEVADEIVDDLPLVTLVWDEDELSEESRLYRMIPIRRTSRLGYQDAPLGESLISSLKTVADTPAALLTLTEPAAIDRVRTLVMQATIEQFEDPPIARELYRWTRFSRRDPNWFRDGLNAEGLDWGGLKAAMARRLLSPGLMGALVRLRLHRILFRGVNRYAPPAPCLGLLVVEGSDIRDRIEAGRLLQRIWLEAADHGLATHPISAAIDHRSTRAEILDVFGVSPGQKPVNLFRVGVSPPCARSARLPVDELLI